MAPSKAYAVVARTHLNTADRPILHQSSTKSTHLMPSHPPRPATPLSKHKLAFGRHPPRLSIRMPSEGSVHQPHGLSGFRSGLRLLIIVLSGSVVALLVHSLEIYRGNFYLDLRKGELPMTWPARTNIAPTIVLLSIAGTNFLASVAILLLSFKKSFRRPIRSRDVYRIVAGSFGVILWVAALVVFNLLDKASKASLGRFSCTNKNVMSNGRYQYRAVCSEQGLAFYVAIGAASAEILTLLSLAITAIQSARRPRSISDEKLRVDPDDREEEEKVSSPLWVTGRYP